MQFDVGEKLFIFLDTNILETHQSNDGLACLSKIPEKKELHDLKNFLDSNKLTSKVSICISEVVYMELQNHLVKCFTSQKKSFEDLIKQHIAKFGDILYVDYKFHIPNKTKYAKNAAKLLDDFLRIFSISVIPYPKNRSDIRRIVVNALNSVPPFKFIKKGNGSGKDITDACFKDVLIYETFIKHIGKKNSGIFVSADNDFNTCFDTRNTNIKLCSSIDETIAVLNSIFDINQSEIIKETFINDTYLQEKIIEMAGLHALGKSEIDSFISCTPVEGEGGEGNDAVSSYLIRFTMQIDNYMYTFDTIYEPHANEVLGVNIVESTQILVKPQEINFNSGIALSVGATGTVYSFPSDGVLIITTSGLAEILIDGVCIKTIRNGTDMISVNSNKKYELQHDGNVSSYNFYPYKT